MEDLKMSTEKQLEVEVLDMVCDMLGLEDVDKDNFNYDAPLFAAYDTDGDSLGLDSVDALELVVGMKERFNVKIRDEDMNVLKSITTMADYIRETRGDE
jgi:acyl carrier protein